MKPITDFLVSFLLAIGASSCAPSSETAPDDAALPDMHTSSTALDWQGTYQGIVPCASCEGIQTSLTLEYNMNYKLDRMYVGESDSIFSTSGTFGWDESGNIAILEGIDDGPNKFKVVEGVVIQLDLDGNEITGNLASNYRLLLAPPVTADQPSQRTLDDVSDSKFVLVELNGNPYTAGVNDKTPYITFDSSEKRASGNAGCNTFIGSYELSEGSRIRFSQMATTMIVCPDMTIEQEILKIFEMADNYNYDGTHLVLNRAKMAPLARFAIEP